MPTSFDSVSIAIERLNARVEAMGTRIAAMEEKQSSDMLLVFSAIDKLARSIDNLKSSVKNIPNPHDQPIQMNTTTCVHPTAIITPVLSNSTQSLREISALVMEGFGINTSTVSSNTSLDHLSFIRKMNTGRNGDSQGYMNAEVPFSVFYGTIHSCLLPVCAFDSVKVPCAFVRNMDFVRTQFSTQSHYTAALRVKPPPKPPDGSFEVQRMPNLTKIIESAIGYHIDRCRGDLCLPIKLPSMEFKVLPMARVKFNKVYGGFEIWNEVQFSCYFQFQWPDEFGNAIESSGYKDMSSEGSDYVLSKEFKNSGAIYSSEGFSEFNELSDAIEGPKELMCLFFSHRKSRADSLGIIEYFENVDGLKELRGRSSFTRGLSSSMKIITFNYEYFKLSIIQSENQLGGSKMYPCAPDKGSGGHGEVFTTSDLTIHDPKPYDEMTREVCIYSTLIYIGFGIIEKAAPKIHGYVFVISDMSSSSNVMFHGIEVVLQKRKIMFAMILQVHSGPEFVVKISIVLMGTLPLWCQSMQAIYYRNVSRPFVIIGRTSYDTICNPREALLICSRTAMMTLGKTLVAIMFAVFVGRDGLELLLFTFDYFGEHFSGHGYHLQLGSRCDCSTLLFDFLVTVILSVAIGGSTFDSQVVAMVLARDVLLRKTWFGSNIDAVGVNHQTTQLGPELASTQAIIILMSGVTKNGLLKMQKASREAGLRFTNHSVAAMHQILDSTAKLEGWVARFSLLDWVGGIMREMSVIGLPPTALQRIPFIKMLVVVALVNEEIQTTKLKKTPAALFALCWNRASARVGLRDVVAIPYKTSILLFSRDLQQLVMESLGKEFHLDDKRVNQGSLYESKGSTHQHNHVQQLRCVHNIFGTFIEVLQGFLKLQSLLLENFWMWTFAWIFSIHMHRCHELLLFSFPRPPEIDDLEDKVDFKGRGMMRINNGSWAAEGPHSYYYVC